jgi:hypothetical protein
MFHRNVGQVRLVLAGLLAGAACSPPAGTDGSGPRGGGEGGDAVVVSYGASGGDTAAGGTTSGGGANPSGGTPAGGASSGGSHSAGSSNGGTWSGGASTGGNGSIPIGGTGNVGGFGTDVFDAGSDPLRNRVAAGQVCERLSTIQCAAEAYCCDAPGRSFDQCKAAQFAVCAEEAYLDAVSLNSISGYDVAAAETAFTEFETRASQCDPTIALWGISPAGLRGITKGTVPSGDNCTPFNPTNLGLVAGHLASCLDPLTTACLPSGVPPLKPWDCLPRAQAGGPCFTDLNCVDGLYCDNDLNAPDLTGHFCQPRKANGTPCVFPNECTSLTCENGSCVEATTQTAYCLL